MPRLSKHCSIRQIRHPTQTWSSSYSRRLQHSTREITCSKNSILNGLLLAGNRCAEVGWVYCSTWRKCAQLEELSPVLSNLSTAFSQLTQRMKRLYAVL